MRLGFTKMHGAGNDFVMIDDREGRLDLEGAFRRRLRALANRPDGIGCEGVIIVRRSARCDFGMRFFNPDGSEAELCGNGARCVAAFAKRIGAVRGSKMRFETLAGEIGAEIVAEDSVRIAMPQPFDLRADFVNSGVPHRIVPVADLGGVDVEREGRRIRLSPEFAPAGTNVDFVRYLAPHTLDLRTYERGVEAESGACGTGTVAAAVVGVAQYGLRFPVVARTRGGYELTVDGEFDGSAFRAIRLTGPVRVVFEGEIELDSLDILAK